MGIAPVSTMKKPPWPRETALELFREEGVDCIDLLPSLEQALAQKMVVQQAPGDDWHPSVEAGRHFAKYLRAWSTISFLFRGSRRPQGKE